MTRQKKKLLEIIDAKLKAFDGDSEILQAFKNEASALEDSEKAIKDWLKLIEDMDFKDSYKYRLENIYDSNHKKWIELGDDAFESVKSLQNNAKKVVRNMKLKSAGIWGAAVAIPVSIMTYFLTRGKKESPEPQEFDRQV